MPEHVINIDTLINEARERALKGKRPAQPSVFP